MKLGFSRQFFEEIIKYNFHENPSNGAVLLHAEGRTDRRTEAQTDRQTADRQADRQTERQTFRQVCRREEANSSFSQFC
jgi:hypothetical protein